MELHKVCKGGRLEVREGERREGERKGERREGEREGGEGSR